MDTMSEPTWDLPPDLDAASWDRMADITPEYYLCHYTHVAPRIDGRLDDPAWEDVPWSDPFVDIEGDRKPAPYFETRMAMRWDDRHLYVAARLEEPHVWGTLTRQNSVIFQDNDFEVFIDPDGDNHNYYELEVNPLNTLWELTLEKPYRDGGPALSPTNIEGLRSAVHVEGTLNAPHDTDEYWSVEIAIPWEGLERYGAAPPADGDRWRMNFSRVHWEHEVVGNSYRKVPDTPEHNWTWSPQGVVDMHRPERWGFVQFSRARPGEDAIRPDPTLEARDALMAVYYAQKTYHKEHGRWASALDDLDTDLTSEIHLSVDDEGWTARTTTTVDGSERTLEVNEESRLVVVP